MNNKDSIKKLLTFDIENDFSNSDKRSDFANDLHAFINQGSQESKGFLKAMIGAFYKTNNEEPIVGKTTPPEPAPAEETPVETPPAEAPAETPPTEETPAPEFPAEPEGETPPEEEESSTGFGDLSSFASAVKSEKPEESFSFSGFYFNE